MQRLNSDIDYLMQKISERIGSKYKLTLICRYTGADYDDADILKSDDDFEQAVSAINRLKDRAPIEERIKEGK